MEEETTGTTSPPVAALLAACVILPAALRDTLLRAAAAGLYQVRWSLDILDEVGRNLIADIGLSKDQTLRLLNAMNRAFPEAMVTGYEGIVSVMQNHPKDRHVLAAAIIGHAEVIVTANLHDFPNTALAPFGIQAQSPDEFLTALFDLNPDVMGQIVRQQVDALVNPPLPISHLLEMLALSAPTFVALIRQALGV